MPPARSVYVLALPARCPALPCDCGRRRGQASYEIIEEHAATAMSPHKHYVMEVRLAVDTEIPGHSSPAGKNKSNECYLVVWWVKIPLPAGVINRGRDVTFRKTFEKKWHVLLFENLYIYIEREHVPTSC